MGFTQNTIMATVPLHASSIYRPLRSVAQLQLAGSPFFPQRGFPLTLGLVRQLVPWRISLPAFTWPGSFPFPALLAPLLELFPPIALAVPKKKVSHSRKSMRSANKGLKDKLSK